MKNAFYFTSEALSHVAKQLDQKDKSNLKFDDITARLTNSCNNILPNISRSKSNQTMNFGQLTECEKRNIFLENSYTKCGRESNLRTFSEKLKLSISLDQWSKVLYNLFLLYVKLRAIEIY